MKLTGKLPTRKRPAPRVLKDIIAPVVAAARPDRIILFGSAARGTMGPHSDVDLLVIKGGKFDRVRLTDQIYHHLAGADEAVDVIMVTPEEVERYRNTPCLVICPAMREGRVVYAAKASTARRSASMAQSGREQSGLRRGGRSGRLL